MKQKRTFITLLLVLAILGLGIAYAAITTQTLQITGTAQATAAEDEINVIFTAATPAEGEDENIPGKHKAYQGKRTHPPIPLSNPG